jgi:FkbM family methyltransferase
MLAFKADDVIGRSLRLYGEWSQHELSCLRPYVLAGTAVVDVGAHIGTHALAFASWVGSGEVFAVEPHSIVASVLTANCLLNGAANIKVVNGACSNRRSFGSLLSPDSSNLGSTILKENYGVFARARRLFSSKEDGREPPVRVLRMDDLAKSPSISLIKIDSEGMELEVLAGAKGVLKRCRPVVYFEQNNTSQLSQIFDLLADFDYRLYWLETHQFNQRNFRGQKENVWWRTETGILALHRSLGTRGDLTEVRRNDDKLPSNLDAREGLAVREFTEIEDSPLKL